MKNSGRPKKIRIALKKNSRHLENVGGKKLRHLENGEKKNSWHLDNNNKKNSGNHSKIWGSLKKLVKIPKVVKEISNPLKIKEKNQDIWKMSGKNYRHLSKFSKKKNPGSQRKKLKFLGNVGEKFLIPENV